MYAEVKHLLKKGERTVYLLSMLVHFQKLAELPDVLMHLT